MTKETKSGFRSGDQVRARLGFNAYDVEVVKVDGYRLKVKVLRTEANMKWSSTAFMVGKTYNVHASDINPTEYTVETVSRKTGKPRTDHYVVSRSMRDWKRSE